MTTIPIIILYSFLSGITVFVGGAASFLFEEAVPDGTARKQVLQTSTAVGGGILVAAVALVLVPEGMKGLPVTPMVLVFLAGAVGFSLVDKRLQTHGGNYAQLLAMLMDFLPEAIALGAVFATHHRLGLLLAIFIGLQNLPESFNSYQDLRSSGFTRRTTLIVLFALSFSGVAAAVLGYVFLRDYGTLKAALMLFSGGGIIYLIFQDIAPMTKAENRWGPALGAGVGFAVGMIGQKLLG